MAKVLVVAGEPPALTALARALRSAGHAVVTSASPEDAVSEQIAAAPDLVVLRLPLTEREPVEMVRRLRSGGTVPIVVLGAGDGGIQTVRLLDAGADDVVGERSTVDEVRARIAAVLRRTLPAAVPPRPPVADVVRPRVQIDPASRRVCIDGAELRLTPLEWRLLDVLVSHPGRLLTHRMIISAVWDDRHGEEVRESLRVHLRALRRKLGDDAASPRLIATEPGVGYRWVGGDL